MPFAVNVDAVAIPLELVTAVAAPPKEAEAPLVGTAKVTVMPLSGLLLASFTRACRLVLKAVFMVALCGVPRLAVTLAGGPARFVKLKLAVGARPATLAITL